MSYLRRIYLSTCLLVPGTPVIPVDFMTTTPPPAVASPLKEEAAGAGGGGRGLTTTVFVGNISEKASNMLVWQLLAKCGIVLRWKRALGAYGQQQAFGFCDFKEPESALRALRLLHELLVVDKKLLVTVDAKMRSANGEEEGPDEETLRWDQVVQRAIEGCIQEYARELNDNHPRNMQREGNEKREDINDMAMEDNKRDMISREIRKFRDTHKKLEEERRERDRERVTERKRDSTRDTSKDCSSSRKCTMEDKKLDNEEDVYEHRRLERRQWDKEMAYQKRLKIWESRERRKTRDYGKEKEREDKRCKDMVGGRYNDDQDDPKYYRGRALQRRLRHREKEAELDDQDRKRSKEELQRMEEEAERRRQSPLKLELPPPQEKSHKERKWERQRDRDRDRERDRDRGRHRARRRGYQNQDGKDPQDAKPALKPMLRPITSAPSVSSGSHGPTPNTPGNESPCGIIIPGELLPKIALSFKPRAPSSHRQPNADKRKKLAEDLLRKRKLVPLDYDDDKSLHLDGAKGNAKAEKKHKLIKNLVNKIPTARPELFTYPLDWSIVDSTLMDRRIKPWINSRIIEYIGEEQAELVDFLCSKVMAQSTPQGILNDMVKVLDREAEVFIMKLWRLLIYETEAKKLGLVK